MVASSVYMLVVLYIAGTYNAIGMSSEKMYFNTMEDCKQARIKILKVDTGKVYKDVTECIELTGGINESN